MKDGNEHGTAGERGDQEHRLDQVDPGGPGSEGIESELSIEAVDDYIYLVQARVDDQDVSVRVRVDPAFSEQLDVAQADDFGIFAETMNYLLGKQRLDELPAQLDLEDVAAAYEDFEESLRQQLRKEG